MSNETLPWVEKYRPSSLDDIIAHSDIMSTLRQLLNSNRLPHLLFYGPPGTGKTSTVLAIARQLYKENMTRMTLELNASDERGIDVVREQVKNFAATGVLFSKGFKLVILDETDQMTSAAQAALRRIIEKYTGNARFCLICNNVNKVIPALQSRCTRFRFAPLPEPDVRNYISTIVEREALDADVGGKEALLKLAHGDLRKVLNIMQSTVLAFNKITSVNVYATTGHPSPSVVNDIVKSLMENSVEDSVKFINQIRLDKGISLIDMLTCVHEIVVEYDFPPKVKGFLLTELAELECRLNNGANEVIQSSALVGIFTIVRELTTNVAVEMTA
ncbi:hypothetical protein RCL1_001736 [Eukaryota sp. TZLM3-RCL]